MTCLYQCIEVLIVLVVRKELKVNHISPMNLQYIAPGVPLILAVLAIQHVYCKRQGSHSDCDSAP